MTTASDRDGTIALVLALCLPVFPILAPVAIVFAVLSRRRLGRLTWKTWIALILGSLVIVLFGLLALLIVLLEHARFTY